MTWDSIVAVKYNDTSEDTIIEESTEIGEDLRELIERWQDRHDDEITMMEKAAWGTAIRELEDLL